MSDHPLLLVPLPLAVRSTASFVAPGARRPDLSAFIEEWATLLLDPVEALADGAADVLAFAGWELGGVARPSAAAIRLLREAGRDERVVAALAASRQRDAIVREKLGIGAEPPIVSLDPARSMPLLAGLAVATALRARVGVLTREMHARERKEQARLDAAKAAEQPSASGGGEAVKPSRPLLSELPRDLRAPYEPVLRPTNALGQ